VKSQLAFARAGLYGSMKKKDTIEFIAKRLIQNRYSKGYVYFFKRKMRDQENSWQLEYIGLQPEDTIQVAVEQEYVEKNSRMVSDDETDIEKEIASIVKELSLEGRKRVSRENDYNDMYEYYEE
jgi:hypothetical protein